MRILSYNVKGLGNIIKWRIIRDLIIKEELIFACFQEIKLETINVRLCRALWGGMIHSSGPLHQQLTGVAVFYVFGIEVLSNLFRNT